MNEERILNAKNKKTINDSVKAAIWEGSDTVWINTDAMISQFTDNLSSKEYAKFNWDKAEKIIFKYSNKLFKQQNLKKFK